MGAGLGVRSNVDSPTMPGQKHVMSGPLDEYCSPEALFEELLGLARCPLEPADKYVFKQLDYTEQDPSSFTLAAQRDGLKLKALKRQEDPQDPAPYNAACRYVQGERIDYDVYNPDGTLQTRCCFLLHKEPLRLEFWKEVAGEHEGDEPAAQLLRTAWLGPAMSRLWKVPVRVRDDVESPSREGFSAISESLDAHFDRARLLGALVQELREPSEGLFIVTARDMPDGGMQQIQSTGSVSLSFLHLLNEEQGTVTVKVSVGSQALVTSFYAVHEGPLRLEAWYEYDGGRTRLGGRNVGSELQDLITRLISAQQSTCTLQ